MAATQKTGWGKKVSVGLFLFVGFANAGALIGHTLKTPIQPAQVNYPPVGEYSSYTVSVNPDGSYTIDYKGHDPTVLDNETYVDTSNGIFGVGGRTVTTRNNQYVPGSPFKEVDEEGKNGARSEECIKAEGGGESNGALVGASVASGFAPMVSGIPYVGWLASGWLVMLGSDLGSSVGAEVATTINGC
mgnify:FL=1|tara:strand:- start:4261 stop:4824 length:564 start_codon:yes stop_codon:yes gene_type:complete